MTATLELSCLIHNRFGRASPTDRAEQDAAVDIGEIRPVRFVPFSSIEGD